MSASTPPLLGVEVIGKVGGFGNIGVTGTWTGLLFTTIDVGRRVEGDCGCPVGDSVEGTRDGSSVCVVGI